MKTLAQSVGITELGLFDQRQTDLLSPDWIQDSLRERHRKQRGFRPNAVTERLNSLDGAPGYMWRAISRALEHGESYLILTLTGEQAHFKPPR